MTKMNPNYARIYNPSSDTNDCCFHCKKCVGGCSWSKDFTPVEGWKIKHTINRDRTDGIKILFCPEFEEGDPADDAGYSENGVVALYEKVCAQAAEDYREAVKAKYEAEKQLQTFCLSKLETQELIHEKLHAESTMYQCEALLGRHAIKLKNLVLTELEMNM